MRSNLDEFQSWAERISLPAMSDDARLGVACQGMRSQPSGYSIRTDVEAEMNREKSRNDKGAARERAPIRQGFGRQKRQSARSPMGGALMVQFSEGRGRRKWERFLDSCAAA